MMDFKPGQIIYEIPCDLSGYGSLDEIDTACVVVQSLNDGLLRSVPLRYHTLVDNQVGAHPIVEDEFRLTQREAIEAAIQDQMTWLEGSTVHVQRLADQLKEKKG